MADTNVLIYILEGRAATDAFANDIYYASVISEIELLGWYKATEPQKRIIERLIEKLHIIDLSVSIKQIAIEIKQQYKVKLPDAIIAATSIYLDIPLLTADTGFEKIKKLNALIIPV